MNRRSFFRGVVAAVSGLAGAVYGLGRPRVGPDGLTSEDIGPDPLWQDPSGKGRTYGTGIDAPTRVVWQFVECHEDGSCTVVGPERVSDIL